MTPPTHPLHELAARVGCDVDELLARIAGSDDVCKYIADRLTRSVLQPDGKEHLLSPPNSISPLPCKLAMDKSAVTACYPEPNDAMKKVVKGLGWHWNWTARLWVFDVGSRNGPALDRLVEAGCALLNRGFLLSLPSAEIARRVQAGDYQPRQERWITKLAGGEHAGWLYITWGRKDDLYAAAKRIHGARYMRPYVATPPESYDEVLDFAEQYGYSISEAALAVIEQARAQAGGIIVVEPPALHRRENVRAQRRLKPTKLPEPVAAQGIADELLDTDE